MESFTYQHTVEKVYEIYDFGGEGFTRQFKKRYFEIIVNS